jgi:diguanylate cyclase (GGDEF)-like protein
MRNEHEKSRILVVDDAPANIKMIGEALREEHQVIFATNGPDALKLAMADPTPDLILLDIVMPGMDGYEVCNELKAESNTKNVPVIFITARTEVEDETKGLELGAVDYITKPFSLAIVKARVRTHLELKHHRDILENLSSQDGLTGIPNRRRFDEVIAQEWQRTRRQKTTLSLVMMDIDHFKAYNDTYGHMAGDECIKQVAQTLDSVAHRASDFVARYGGEEFVAVLPDTDNEGAVALAEKMREGIGALQIPHAESSAADHVTLSLGVSSIIPAGGSSPGALIESADKALYQAKETGRNKVETLLIESPDNDA